MSLSLPGSTTVPMKWEHRERIIVDLVPQEADRELLKDYFESRSTGESCKSFLKRWVKKGIAWPDVSHLLVYYKLEALRLQAEDVRKEYKRQILEDEADRRAVDGVVEDVYHQGEVVGQVRKYSDGLLKYRLGAEDPDKYSERHKHEVKGAVLHINFTGIKREESDTPQE